MSLKKIVSFSRKDHFMNWFNTNLLICYVTSHLHLLNGFFKTKVMYKYSNKLFKTGTRVFGLYLKVLKVSSTYSKMQLIHFNEINWKCLQSFVFFFKCCFLKACSTKISIKHFPRKE